jgi:phosphoribosyl-dephospho-CoA transferase
MAITIRELSADAELAIKTVKETQNLKTSTGAINYVLTNFHSNLQKIKHCESENEKILAELKDLQDKLRTLKESYSKIKEVLEEETLKYDKQGVDYKNFSLNELNLISTEIRFKLEKNAPIKKNEKLTISNHFFISDITKGSENIYFTIKVYRKNKNEMTEFEITAYTKEDHRGLKKVLIDIIDQA